jgi:catechol 2,3-dioxygenase-like lactoylglutathione lyase family enzyme
VNVTHTPRIHHIAIVVDDLEAALDFWRDGIGLLPTATKDIPAEEARVVFMPAGDR